MAHHSARSVLDLFERRHAIYEIVRKAVGTMVNNSTTFDQTREVEYMQAIHDADFFGDDVCKLCQTIVVRHRGRSDGRHGAKGHRTLIRDAQF